jgi:hypothetical protein
MRNTAASCFPSTNKARRREVDAHSAGQGGTRASPARLGATPAGSRFIVWQGVDAPRLPAKEPTWPAATQEKPGPREGGRNFSYRSCSSRVPDLEPKSRLAELAVSNQWQADQGSMSKVCAPEDGEPCRSCWDHAWRGGNRLKRSFCSSLSEP